MLVKWNSDRNLGDRSLPDKDGVESGDLPILVRKQGDKEVQAIVLPQVSSAFATGMCHVAQYRKHELLRRPISFHDLEEKRDDSVRRCVLLALLAEPTEIEHGI